MSYPTQDEILAVLASIPYPGSDSNIVAEGLVSALSATEEPEGLHIHLILEINPAKAQEMEAVRMAAEIAIKALPGIARTSILMTAHKGAPNSPTAKKTAAPTPQLKLPDGVTQVIAVASGKGGVGKSTTAVNIAIALALQGKKVGILDADVYGPSIPRLLNLKEEVEENEKGLMKPLVAHGIAAMSIGLLVDERDPVIWRGPMVHSALRQMLYEVDWGKRDVLILDMPPGTGDTALSIAQQVPLAGAIIVSTPQDLALIDVRKGIAMFQKVGVPILGVIENMSTFQCPHCGEETPIFGVGGAKEEAEKLGVPFLGQIPLDLKLRQTSDAGCPVTSCEPESPHAGRYKSIAEQLQLDSEA